MSFTGSCEVCGKVIRNLRGLAGHLRHNSDPAHLYLKKVWEGTKARSPSQGSLTWVRGDALWSEVVSAVEAGERLRPLMRRLAVTYKTVRGILVDAWGEAAYDAWAHSRKARVAKDNIAIAHAEYASLSPEEKAKTLKQRFSRRNTLETMFAEQLRNHGIVEFDLNVWQALPIEGALLPREADLKVRLADGRKVVVLCDGEAFHGPTSVFSDKRTRTQDDVLTAEAYFSLGYSVLRYSETEIKEGRAVQHFVKTLSLLSGGARQVLRIWFLPEERIV